MTRKKVPIRARLIKRIRRIANKHKITYAEANKIFKSQFEFTRDTIEGIEEEYLANATEEELKEMNFNYIYLGKMFSSIELQKFAHKKKQKLIKKRNGREEESKEF